MTLQKPDKKREEREARIKAFRETIPQPVQMNGEARNFVGEFIVEQAKLTHDAHHARTFERVSPAESPVQILAYGFGPLPKPLWSERAPIHWTECESESCQATVAFLTAVRFPFDEGKGDEPEKQNVPGGESTRPRQRGEERDDSPEDREGLSLAEDGGSPPEAHQVKAKPDYESLHPEYIRAEMARWIESRIKPSSFLWAVIRDNLAGAVFRADFETRVNLSNIVNWMQREAPRECWGSEKLAHAWADRKKEAMIFNRVLSASELGMMAERTPPAETETTDKPEYQVPIDLVEAPEFLRQLKAWSNDHRRPKSLLLWSILTNDLGATMFHSSEKTDDIIRPIVKWLTESAPEDSWGSRVAAFSWWDTRH